MSARKRIDAYLGPQEEIINPSELDKYEKMGEWVLQLKVDGCHGVLDTGTNASISSLVSRTGQHFTEAAELVGRDTGLPDTTLIGEYEVKTQHSLDVVQRRGVRRYWAFDIVRLHGQDVREEPLETRRALLEKAIDVIYHRSPIVAERIIMVPQVESGFAAAYKRWKAEGGEGAVAKKRGSKYKRQTSDGRTTNWRRFKDVCPVDLYVIGTGLTPSRAINLRVGLWRKGKPIELQSLALPKGYTAEQLLGTVIECEYDTQLESGKYRHLRFVRTRPDKTKEMTG